MRDPTLTRVALATKGFMPADEGDALHAAALAAATAVPGAPFVEIGSYCGRSTIWLGDAAGASSGPSLFAVDHHRGSEENQAGLGAPRPELVDARIGRMDTLPFFRAAIHDAGLEARRRRGRRPVAGRRPPLVDAGWRSCSSTAATASSRRAHDYDGWTPHVAVGGTLAIHDVFPDPADGGRPPYEQIYLPAIASGRFRLASVTGSLRVLRRVG